MTAVPPLPGMVRDTPAMRAFQAALARLTAEAIASGLPGREVLLVVQHEGWRIAAGERG